MIQPNSGRYKAPENHAFETFLKSHPSFEDTQSLEGVRQKEYGRLDLTGHTYLDYTGGGLCSDSQMLEHLNLLRGNVFGNPHSGNPASVTTTRLVDNARDYILEYFSVPRRIRAIFTANAAAAIKLVARHILSNLGTAIC